MSLCEFGRLSKGDDGGDILGASTLGLLLTSSKQGCVAGFAIHIESTDSLGSAEFMCGEGDILDTEFLEVDRHLSRRLNRIEVQGNLFTCRDRGDFLDGKEDSGLVIGPEQGDDSCFGGDGVLKLIGI